jgi:formamidopyrimidine-DNA glycosylase
MPELPDVEFFRRQVERTCRGRTIHGLRGLDRRLLQDVSPKQLTARCTGARITGTLRHGKHLLIQLGRAGWLTLHFGTNGSLSYVAATEPAPAFVRLWLDFADGNHLAYINPRRIGGIGIASDPKAFVAMHRLGPDALDSKFDFSRFAAALRGRRRDLKSILMDQALCAGIGNIFADEILFQAGIRPTTSGAALDQATLRRVFRALKEVLRATVKRGAGAEQRIDRLPAGFLIPQRHKSGRCPRCGRLLKATTLSGRPTYFCVRCQTKLD